MGNSSLKKDEILVSYRFQLRKDPITFKIFDDFPYPKKLKNIEIEDQFQQILQNCILNQDQFDQIKTLTFDIKWKLICKHRFMILTRMCDRQAKKSISLFYVESIKKSTSIADLAKFFAWLTKEAKGTDINSFLGYGGLKILLELLQKCRICSRSTKNYTRPILILKILNYLTRFPQVVDHLVVIPSSATDIFLNFNLYNWELSKYVLQLLNDYMWKDEKGQNIVIEALNAYKKEFNHKHRFEPLQEILSNSKNLILLESVLGFINALIESPEKEEKRTILRSEISSCGFKGIITGIKEKIEKDEYKLEDCNFQAYLEECQDNEYIELTHNNSDALNNSHTSIYFTDNEGELFSKKKTNVQKQIEIFENGFLEFLEEIDEESDNSESMTSLIQEDCNTHSQLKNKDIDYSDLNDLFQRTRTKTLQNDNFEDFLAIMQYFYLIPSNEIGNKMWGKIRKALNEANEKEESALNLTNLKNMFENQEKYEEIENKVIFLNSQLRIRDDEIKQLQYKIKEADFTKQTYKTSNELIIKNLLKEKEVNKILNNKILENELRSNKLLKDRDDKIKRLDNKIKEISRNLSYSSYDKPSSTQSSPTNKNQGIDLKLGNQNLKMEIEKLKKTKSTTSKPPTKTQTNESLIKESLKIILEKEENFLNSEQSLKNKTDHVSKAIQTESSPPDEIEEEIKSTIEIIPSINNNLSNITENLANSKDNPIGKKLIQSMKEIENEILQSFGGQTSEEYGILSKKERGNSLHREKDQAIENLTKRVKELEFIINNLPNSVEKDEKPHPNFRTRRHSIIPSVKSIQFRLEDNSSSNPHRATIEPQFNKDFEPIIEDENENKIKKITPLSKQTSILMTENCDKVEEDLKNLNIIFPPPPPPPPPPPLSFLMGSPQIGNFKTDGPIKVKKEPKVPMKQVCWTTINPVQLTNTVWETINENEVLYDMEELEKQFTSKRPEKIQERKKIINPNVKVTLLTMNRSKNISIALTRLKMSLSAISEAAYKLDQNKLNLNVVNSLLEACPKESDEINLVNSYEGDKAMLDLPEQFVLEIANVSGFRIRLEALQFYLTYKELVEDFTSKTEKLTDLFENILKNEKFSLLLKYTLALGNYFNGAGVRGGAFGFKLDAFDKIVDMKSVDGKKSFLTYIIELIEKNTESNFIDCNEDLRIYEIGRKLPISQMITDLADIKKGYKIVNEAIQSKTDNPFDNVENTFSDFEKILKTNINEFEQMIDDIQDLYQLVCEYYCEDPIETPSNCFVEKVFKIWTACKKVKTNLVKEKELLKKEEIMKKKMEERQKKNTGQNKRLENPEELANYIQQRRITRKKTVLQGKRHGSIIMTKMSIKENENNIL